MSTLEVNTINPQSGTTVTLGSSGNTVALGSGVSGSGFGKIGQVVNSSTDYNQVSTSTSAVDLNSASGVVWETSITPSSTSSKILVLGSLSLNSYFNGGSEGRGSCKAFYKIGSGSYTQFKDYNESIGAYDYDSSAPCGIWSKKDLPISTLVSPNTTSAVTFKFQMLLNSPSATIVWNTGTSDSQLTLMEVLA